MLRGLLLLLRETAMLRGLLLLLRGTAAERTAAIAERTTAERNCARTRELLFRSLVAPRAPGGAGGFHVIFSYVLEKGYKAPFLEPEDHARMKDLKILVPTVALKPLYDFSRPISYQKFAPHRTPAHY